MARQMYKQSEDYRDSIWMIDTLIRRAKSRISRKKPIKLKYRK